MASPPDFSRRSAFAQMPSYPLPKPRLSRAPQHNPYDKFTQDEFDAWIGGITSALKRALGQEDQGLSPPVTSAHYHEQLNSDDEEEVERLVEFLGDSSDDESEASFSYSAARRVSKGKARDPRDGPGFGRGDQNEPIFIGSDSDEEEESEDGQEAEDGEDGEDGDGDEDEDGAIEEWDSQDGDKSNIDWAEAESSMQARTRHKKQDLVEESEEEEEEEEEDEDEEEEEFGGDEIQGEEEEDSYDEPSLRQSSPPVLVVDSDEEVEVHGLASKERVLDGTEYIMERSDEDDVDPPLSMPIRVDPPRHRAKQQRHVSPTERRDIGDHEDTQPLANDTSFPPHEVSSANEDKSIELPDRWVGPETYAEDYYAGGDVKESHNSSADVLGMEHDERPQATAIQESSRLPLSRQRSVEGYDEEPQAQDVIQLDIDEAQPLSEDTSFPPKITEDNHLSLTLQQPIEIPDPWVGPKTYAEDFYSGGDVRPLQNGVLDPHRLGADDQSDIMAAIPQHELEAEAQPLTDVDAGDLSSKGYYETHQLDYTVELLGSWDESINDEEDHFDQVEIESCPQMAENRSAACNDGDIQMIVDYGDETAPVKSQDTTERSSHDATKLAQDHIDGRVERVVDHLESPATSCRDDPFGCIPLAQAEVSNLLHDGIAVLGEAEHSVRNRDEVDLDTGTEPTDSQALSGVDDAPVLDWINDSAFTHDMSASTAVDVKHSNLDPSISESIENVDSNEKTVDKIGESLRRGTNDPVLEAQLPIVKAFAEETADAVDQIPSEAQSETRLESTPEPLKVGIQWPSASLGTAGNIEDASPAQHDKEPGMARDDTDTSDKIEVDIDLVFREDLVAPEIREIEETDVKLDVGARKDGHEVPEVQRKVFTQSPTVNHIEVLDRDPAASVDVASKESSFESKEPVTVAVDLDNFTLTPPEPEIIVSRSATPILTEEVQSLNGDVNTSVSADTGKIDSQVAPASQDELTSADLMAQTSPIDTLHSQSSDLILVTPRSITEPPEPVSHRVTDLAVTPPASESLQHETMPKEQNILNSSIDEGTFSADSGVGSASGPFPDPALPWIGPYSMNVIMRKASEPFLFADPYPASLSTPHDTTSDYAVSFGQFFLPDSSPSFHNVPEGGAAGRNVVDGQTESKLSTNSNEHEVPLVQHDGSIAVPVEVANDAHSNSVATGMSPLPTSKVSVVDNTTQDTDPDGVVPLSQHDDTAKVKSAHDVESTLAIPVATELNGPLDSKPMVQSTANDDNDENTAQQSSPLSSPTAESIDRPSNTRVRNPPLADDLPSILIVKKVQTDDRTPVKVKVGQSRKRKRTGSSVRMTSPLTRTDSLKQQDKNKTASRLPAKSRVPNRKTSRTENGKNKEQSRLVPRTSSSVWQHDLTESSTSKQSTPSSHRHPTYSSSPVTRSNCRYHKISIPLDDESDEEGSGDEDVKLVYFLVPGCSLGNQELNRDEKIIDHGDAQPSDGLLMTSDLDAYAFNAPLLSVLRLLVGVDMLREGEIYYLPLPGSDWVPRKVRETSAKNHQSSAEYGPSHVAPRRNSSISALSVSISPIASQDTASTTFGPSRSLKPSSTISQTSSELTEVEDSPQLKRFRVSAVGEEGKANDLKSEFGSRPRQLKVLGQDSENQPIPHDESNHLVQHADGRARSKKGNKHGVKRNRTSDVVRGTDDGQQLKKQKINSDLPPSSST
ncbi:hypothetical protein C0993_010945 [Termitomyces sp. T159_Od127]|nr:hypothetical protein C0993_010945 [Termitomyces sp. T159_Od127]